MTRIATAVGIALVLCVAGCAAPQRPDETLPDPEAPAFEYPSFVAVLTDGVTIQAEDGSFVLESGEPQAAPFRTRHVGRILSEELLDSYDRFLEAGARKVRVAYPGLSRPLYGVLALKPVAETSEDSSARRSYRVAIPRSRVEQARGAQIAMAFQPYDFTETVERTESVTIPGGPLQPDGSYTREIHESEESVGLSWILWISDAPFAGHDTNWSPPR